MFGIAGLSEEVNYAVNVSNVVKIKEHMETKEGGSSCL